MAGRVVHGEDVAAAHGAIPVPKGEFRSVQRGLDRLVRAADLPAIPLWIQDAPEPNAFAMGFTPYDSVIAVTTGLLELLDPAEVLAVLAHEVGHVTCEHIATTTAVVTRLAQRDGLLAGAVLASAVLVLADVLADEFLSIVGAARLVHAHVADNRIREMNHRNEFEADAHSRSSGYGPWLASSLRRLDAARSAVALPPWARLAHTFSRSPTHPSTRDRLAAVSSSVLEWHQHEPCSTCLQPNAPGLATCPTCSTPVPRRACSRCRSVQIEGRPWCTTCGGCMDEGCPGCGQPDGGTPFCTTCGHRLPR